MRCQLAGAQPFLWDLIPHGSGGRGKMPQTRAGLEGLFPKPQNLGANRTPFASGQEWTEPSSRGLLILELWGWGKN